MVKKVPLAQPATTAPSPPRGAPPREVIGLLSQELLPVLRRAGTRPLVKAVKDAIDAEDPRRLAQLPERQRRDLLEVLETHLARSRRGLSPRAVVALTAAILSDSLPVGAASARRLGPPAR